MKKVFIDTNVFLRFLLADHKTQSPATKKLFTEAKNGKIILITHSLVIAEIIFTLDSFFNLSKKEIIKKINIILLFKELEIVEKNVLLQSITFYKQKNIDFIDTFIASFAFKNKIDICSFDRDFDKIKEVKRVDPSSF